MKYSGKKDGVTYISEMDEEQYEELDVPADEFESGPEKTRRPGETVLKVFGIIFFCLQAVFSALLVILLIKADLLPDGLFAAVIAVLVVLLGFVFYTQFLAGKLKKEKPAKKGEQESGEEAEYAAIEVNELDLQDDGKDNSETVVMTIEDPDGGTKTADGIPGEQEETGKKKLPHSKGFKRRLAGMIVSIVLCAALALADYYVYITINLLDKVTGTVSSVQLYDVVVLSDDSAQELADTAGYTFGTQSSYDSEGLEYILSYIYEETGVEVDTEDYSTTFEQVEALYAGEVQVILYDNSFSEILDETYDDYTDTVKIIAQIRVESETEAETVEAADVDVLTEPFVVFISGNDQYGELSTTGRSDVNMLVVVNPNTAQVLLVSIPRDYYVYLSGISTSMADKLTHAGIYGIATLQQTVEDTFDIDINYYVQVNFTSLVEIIDAIGGVTVYNDYGFDSYNADYYFEEGYLDLDGTHALLFARERYNLVDGDFGRGRNQQKLIKAMIEKLTSAASLTYYTALVDALDDCAVTNMSSSKISDIVKSQLANGTEWEVLSAQAYGSTMSQPCYSASGQYLSVVMPYTESIEDINDLITRVLNGEVITEDDTDLSYSSGTYATSVSSSSSSKSTSSSQEETEEETTTASFYAEEETTTAAAQQETTAAAQEETTAAQEETTVAQEETTAAQEETTAAQEETTAAQEETTAAQEETTTAAQETAAASSE